MHAETLAFWTTIAISFAFDSVQTIDRFNAEIQRDVEYWEHRRPDEALQLAQLKLEINRRFYWAHHAA